MIVKYSLESSNVRSLTMPPNAARIGLLNIKYITVSTALTSRQITTALPTVLCASSSFFAPRLMLTNVQAPSPIITASDSAIIVIGKTTVFAALPYEPR